MKKRLFSLALAVLFALITVPVTVIAEDSDTDNQHMTRFAVETVSDVKSSDEFVEVNIQVQANSGFASMTYQISYDSEIFSLEQAPVLGDIEGFEFLSGPIDTGKHMGFVVSTNNSNVRATGNLITYTFKINPDAQSGFHEIKIITEGFVEMEDGSSRQLGVINENLASVSHDSINGGVIIPGYTISYDANGGGGAPLSQYKAKGASVTISDVIPVRNGYSFLGWATGKTATASEYKAGDTYSANADLTLYAVWKEMENAAGSIDIKVSTVNAKQSDEVEVVISAENNTGVSGIDLSLVFDDTKLSYVSSELVEHEDSEITLDKFMFIPPEAQAATDKVRIGLVADVENLVGEGDIVKVKFKVLDTAEDGVAEISVVTNDVFCLYGPNMDETTLKTNVTNGGVRINCELLGDINLDENVDIDDAILLFQYSVLPDVYPIEYIGNVDFDKSGTVDIDDAILLFQYSVLPDIYPIG